MERMSIEQVCEFIALGGSLILSTSAGEISIQAEYELQLDKGETNFNLCGFVIECAEQSYTMDDVTALKQKIVDIGAVGTDRMAHVVLINGKYMTMAEYEKATALNELDMKGLLDKYSTTADRFSLSVPYNEYSKVLRNRYKFHLDEKIAENAGNEVMSWAIRESRRIYEGLDEDVRLKLPAFDILMEEIVKECEDAWSKIKGKSDEPFMCDRFAIGETKYTAPQELWRIYNDIDFAISAGREAQKMIKVKKTRALEYPLDKPENEILLRNLIEIKVGFVWHCNVSSRMAKTFFISLNDETKNWLSAFKDDYSITQFEDLAFYNGEKLLYSSCTHEGFRTDYSDSK